MTFLIFVISVAVAFICGVLCSLTSNINKLVENSFDTLAFLDRQEKRQIRQHNRKKGRK